MELRKPMNHEGAYEGAAPPPAPCGAWRRRVLVAEDDPALRGQLATILRGDGHEVVEASDGLELLDHIAAAPRTQDARRCRFDIIVTDVWLPGLTGIDILALLNLAQRATPVILVNTFEDDEIRAEALELGAAAIFDQPLDVDRLRRAILGAAPAW